MPPVPSKVLPKSKVLSALPQDDVWNRIKPVALDWDNVKLKILIFGDTGVGKTTLASTFPKPILWVLCSGGNRKADELWSIIDDENHDDIFEVSLHSSNELINIVDKAESSPFKTIVVDHLTGFSNLVLKGILGRDVPEQKFWGVAQQQEWGQVTYQATELLAPMLNLDKHIVWTAHERSFEPKKALEGGRKAIADDGQVASPFIGPALTPALAGWVNGAVNFVCQAYKTQKVVKTLTTLVEGEPPVEMEEVQRGVDYWLRMEASNIYKSKIRLPLKWLSRLHDLKNPSYFRIMQMIRGQL